MSDTRYTLAICGNDNKEMTRNGRKALIQQLTTLVKTWMKKTDLLLQGRLQQRERVGDERHYFLCCICSFKTEQHCIGNVVSAGSKRFDQRLQSLFVPIREGGQ